jgi:hypothetical protein
MMKSACAMLLKKIGREIWRRGEKYASNEMVAITQQDDKQVCAVVAGTQLYTVSIRFAPNGISQECNCPYFTEQGYVCKHIVAVAIVWDSRRSISPPASQVVELATVPPPRITRREINELHRRPLEADLDRVRILPEATALGGRGRPHSELPPLPKKLNTDAGTPFTCQEISSCLTEIRSWSRRKAFDPYFCAGEMVAAFCEMVRIVAARVPVSNKAEAVNILLTLQQFNREMVTELIDDSQGNRVFSEAHLDDLCERFKQIDRNDSDYELVHRTLKRYEKEREVYD